MSGYWFESGKQSTDLVMMDSNGLSSEHQGHQPEFFASSRSISELSRIYWSCVRYFLAMSFLNAVKMQKRVTLMMMLRDFLKI